MPRAPTTSDKRTNDLRVSLVNEQSRHPIDEEKLIEAVQAVVRDSPFTSASISLAIVDDATMHQLNRQYLNHDYPTDVLSFLLQRAGDQLEGEVVVSSDTAKRSAAQFGWTPENELLLYVIHGTLHLVGYDDSQPDLLAEMRRQEQHYLSHFGLQPRY